MSAPSATEQGRDFAGRARELVADAKQRRKAAKQLEHEATLLEAEAQRCREVAQMLDPARRGGRRRASATADVKTNQEVLAS